MVIGRLWRWFWRSWLRIPLLAGAGALVLLVPVTMVVVHVYGGQFRPVAADVIVVLGAGVERDGSPTGGTIRRGAVAADLYREGYAPLILCAGGFAAPRAVSEAESCQQVLAAAGIPLEVIWLEDRSKSTEENAIYSGRMMADRGWESALVVTDRYHVLRAEALFVQHQVPVAAFVAVPANQIPAGDYVWRGLRREAMALFWQAAKSALNLPNTHVDLF